MPHPYVTNVTLKDEKIVLTVEVDELPSGETLEISGYATQSGGAFAVFNEVQPVPDHLPDGRAYMYVKAPPSGEFKKGHSVTVVLRAGRVWTTVLGEPQPEPGEPVRGTAEPDEPAEEGATWNDVRKVTYAVPSSTGNAGQTSAGGEASFQDT